MTSKASPISSWTRLPLGLETPLLFLHRLARSGALRKFFLEPNRLEPRAETREGREEPPSRKEKQAQGNHSQTAIVLSVSLGPFDTAHIYLHR